MALLPKHFFAVGMIKTKTVQLVRKNGIQLLTKLEQKMPMFCLLLFIITGERHQDSLLQPHLETAVVVMGKKGGGEENKERKRLRTMVKMCSSNLHILGGLHQTA